jgi:uncharacterized protein (DUF486 family)
MVPPSIDRNHDFKQSGGRFANNKRYNGAASPQGGTMNPVFLKTTGLLIGSNLFMTFAWYAHLKDMAHRPGFFAALVSWGLAFFEYCLQVPANRIGHGAMSLPQLKILQEVVSLTVFVPFAVYYMGQPLKWNYVWAGLCVLGAVYFIFRG